MKCFFSRIICVRSTFQGAEIVLPKLEIVTLHETSIKTFSTQPTVTCSKLTIKTLEQGMKYVQS